MKRSYRIWTILISAAMMIAFSAALSFAAAPKAYFNTNGGLFEEGGTVREGTVDGSGYVTPPEEEPYYADYHKVFDLWSERQSGYDGGDLYDDYWNFTDRITSNKTYYAHWLDAYKLTFDAGTAGSFEDGSRYKYYACEKGDVAAYITEDPEHEDELTFGDGPFHRKGRWSTLMTTYRQMTHAFMPYGQTKKRPWNWIRRSTASTVMTAVIR